MIHNDVNVWFQHSHWNKDWQKQILICGQQWYFHHSVTFPTNILYMILHCNYNLFQCQWLLIEKNPLSPMHQCDKMLSKAWADKLRDHHCTGLQGRPRKCTFTLLCSHVLYFSYSQNVFLFSSSRYMFFVLHVYVPLMHICLTPTTWGKVVTSRIGIGNMAYTFLIARQRQWKLERWALWSLANWSLCQTISFGV